MFELCLFTTFFNSYKFQREFTWRVLGVWGSKLLDWYLEITRIIGCDANTNTHPAWSSSANHNNISSDRRGNSQATEPSRSSQALLITNRARLPLATLTTLTTTDYQDQSDGTLQLQLGFSYKMCHHSISLGCLRLVITLVLTV